jgi:pyruvate formate lyase activating enzyme
MRVHGWVRTSLIDYPDHIATVLFTGGCNFRCPMCHNADLVLRPDELPVLPADEIWRFLERRQGLVTGVVVTGGEPTLHPDLGDFLRAVQELGFDVKLDTNGYRPAVLERLLAAGLVDAVAMDVKAPPAAYPQLAGVPHLDVDRIARSVALLRESGVPCEFRTTVVPPLLDADAIEALARWLAGPGAGPSTAYALQQFRPVNTLDPALASVTPYPPPALHAMADRARRWLPDVILRGV